jgi:GNAT superfamily N-acetyltransferase
LRTDSARLALYDSELRMNPPPPDAGYRIERSDRIVRLIGPTTAAHDNCIIYSRLDAAGADAAIAGEIAYFGAAGLAFEWKLHDHDPPADLAERLQRRGFVPQTPETLIVRDLAEHPPASPPEPLIDVHRVGGSSEMADFVAVQDAVWGEDHGWLGDALAREHAADPTQIEILVAYTEGDPVATSYMRLHRGTCFASLWGASTLPAWQRRGIYSALTEHHAAVALAAGKTLITVDANENSRPVLARLGFRPLVRTQGFVWSPPA